MTLLRERLLIFGCVELALGVIGYALLVWRLRWIVPRFEENPDLLHHPLFFPYTPWGLRTLSYVCDMTSLDIVPDWIIRRGIAWGNAPASASKDSARQHFSADELRRIRWAGRAVLAWLLVFVGLAIALRAVPR